MGLAVGAAIRIYPEAQIFTSGNGGLPFSWTGVVGMVAKNAITFQHHENPARSSPLFIALNSNQAV